MSCFSRVLKRFKLQDGYCSKINTAVIFPLTELDLVQYSARQTSCRFSLYGIVSHSGTLSFGHYTAHCKHPFTGRWHIYNDSQVHSASLRTIKGDGAYIRVCR